ncbi:hypothetical protein EUGRSUZ_B02809 [Eucalyptus grandis]|uniref:TF-B3 domain-containing protein n=2 Tax=Eucalyptus grandis TaxID=71139 RepID=A0A059D6R9_EUCGR|nr:hypothetical protein EUGRSUZ_B02809 [Eucalyptus grandis]
MTSCRRRGDEENRQSFALETPHFFKIVLSQTLQIGRLSIPKRFVRKYGKNLPKTLRERIPPALPMGGCEGHLLVFKYVENSDFHVLIFDKSASEIDYPLMNTDSKKSNLDFVKAVPPIMGDTDDHYNISIELERLNGFSLKRKEKDKLHLIPFHHKPSKTVPGRVLKGCIDGRTQTATLKYLERSWTVKLLYYRQHGLGKLSAGWSAFQRGTSLKEGDVCVFEPVRIDIIELEVSTF